MGGLLAEKSAQHLPNSYILRVHSEAIQTRNFIPLQIFTTECAHSSFHYLSHSFCIVVTYITWTKLYLSHLQSNLEQGNSGAVPFMSFTREIGVNIQQCCFFFFPRYCNHKVVSGSYQIKGSNENKTSEQINKSWWSFCFFITFTIYYNNKETVYGILSKLYVYPLFTLFGVRYTLFILKFTCMNTSIAQVRCISTATETRHMDTHCV